VTPRAAEGPGGAAMDPALRAFRDLVAASDVDLARAALAIAAIEHPDLRPADHLARLDELAVRSGAAALLRPRARLDRLRAFLFAEEGFRGNADDYYDPRNSCLNDVLDRRLGIPITLALVTIEVGRRVGLALDGVGLPGHFVVGARFGADVLLLDAFGGGELVDRGGAEALAARAMGRPVRLRAAHFAAVSGRQIVARMLRNLQGAYARRRAWGKTLAVVERLLVVDGEAAAHVRDRGTALVNLGRLQHGAAEWERYLRGVPNAADATRVREELRRVRQILGERN